MRSHVDSACLQEDLERIAEWSELWKLSLNASKYKAMTVTLKRNPVSSVYTVRGTHLEQVDTMRDLGVVLDNKLTFAAHVDSVISKARRSLGVLMRSFQFCHGQRGLINKSAALTAYRANVRSILEYGSQIWAGAAKTHLDRLEHVQHKFLLWLSNRTDIGRQSRDLSYTALLRLFKLSSLASRRYQHDIVFFHSILKGRSDSMFLLRCFSIHVPSRMTRSCALFHVPFARVNSIRQGLFCRMPRHANDFISKCPHLDFLQCSKYEIVRNVTVC